jgi:nucleolar GTP-binding protein
MVLYNFKKMQPIPDGKALIDITLSKTQRKTPTEIHRHYKISRIRRFYMRKVKFTQQNYHDSLSQIISDFPLLNDIHPFYADLINILYDRDHYKLALGQLNQARYLIDGVAKDYLRLLKYGDSMYRCQSLKKAALGRMCTVIKKLSPSLSYLEQVRQHLARLPSIDPATRTLLVCGYPNVGKSSFMNQVSRANVDVQPYAFTTKSLFVGHFDYKFVRWQVIDTPGILDHPLEDRNTVEMLSITALAHLQAAVLFLIDISEQCGYTIEEQIKLFNSIKPLFQGKPLMIVVNKIDVVRPENVRADAWKLIESLTNPEEGGSANVQIIPTSTLTAEGVEKAKEQACDVLLEARVEKKLKSKVSNNVINRIHVAIPIARDERVRAPCIPKSVSERMVPEKLTKQERAMKQLQETLEEEEQANEMWARGEVPGMNSKLWRERWQLANPEWKFDAIPEIIDGKTIFDFVDPDIEKMLDELEREENERVQALEDQQAMESSESEIDEETMGVINKIREKRALFKLQKRTGVSIDDNDDQVRETPREQRRGRSLEKLGDHLTSMGLREDEAQETVDRVRSRSRSQSRTGRKRERSVSRGKSQVRDEEAHLPDKKKLKRSKSRERSVSLTPKPGSGYSNVENVEKAAKIYKRLLVARGKEAKKGEADRTIPNLMPKHLYSGKRGIGKTQRR